MRRQKVEGRGQKAKFSGSVIRKELMILWGTRGNLLSYVMALSNFGDFHGLEKASRVFKTMAGMSFLPSAFSLQIKPLNTHLLHYWSAINNMVNKVVGEVFPIH